VSLFFQTFIVNVQIHQVDLNEFKDFFSKFVEVHFCAESFGASIVVQAMHLKRMFLDSRNQLWIPNPRFFSENSVSWVCHSRYDQKKTTINAARNAIKGCHSLPWSQNTTPRCLDHRPRARTDEASVSRGVLDWGEVYIYIYVIYIYTQAHTLCVWYVLFTDLYTRQKMHTHIMYTYLPLVEMAWYRHFACLAWLIHIDAWILTLSLQVPCGISSITPMD